MCCLKYENDQYEEAKRELPDIGRVIHTPFGSGKVVGMNILDKVVQIEISEENERVIEYSLEELVQEGIIQAQVTE